MNKKVVYLNGPSGTIHLCERESRQFPTVERWDGAWELGVRDTDTEKEAWTEINYCPFCGEELGATDGD